MGGSTDYDGESRIMLESYEGEEIIDILKQALAGNRAKYICVDGDGIVPTESAKDLSSDCFSPISRRDGLKAVARVGVPGDHRGLSVTGMCSEYSNNGLRPITTPTTTP
ncbi:hypothetical protein Sjap_020204 [Stephania japonica]|uniref:Uncharacterized protein n=1 Tax=Stephania japonica TaxID=461633 RepID=A0AAP0F2Y7_9MAGN